MLNIPPRNSGRAVGLSGPQFPPSYLIPGFSHGLVTSRLCLCDFSHANAFTLSHLVSSATTCWKTDRGTSTAWCVTPASWPLPTPRNVSAPPFHRTTVSLKRLSDGLTVPRMSVCGLPYKTKEVNVLPLGAESCHEQAWLRTVSLPMSSITVCRSVV